MSYDAPVQIVVMRAATFVFESFTCVFGYILTICLSVPMAFERRYQRRCDVWTSYSPASAVLSCGTRQNVTIVCGFCRICLNRLSFNDIRDL